MDRFLRVAVSSRQAKDLNVMSKWRLDLSGNRVTYERCMLAIECFASPLLRQDLKGSLVTVARSKTSNDGTKSETLTMIGEGAMAVRGLILGVEEVNARADENTLSESTLSENLSKILINREELSVAKSPPLRISGKLFGVHKGTVRALLTTMQDDLNKSQRIAIEAAMNERVTLWQGPPGTGKTRTLVRLIAAFCRSRQGQVLACADRYI